MFDNLETISLTIYILYLWYVYVCIYIYQRCIAHLKLDHPIPDMEDSYTWGSRNPSKSCGHREKSWKIPMETTTEAPFLMGVSSSLERGTPHFWMVFGREKWMIPRGYLMEIPIFEVIPTFQHLDFGWEILSEGGPKKLQWEVWLLAS